MQTTTSRVQEMARALLQAVERDDAQLRSFASREDASFEAYASEYAIQARRVCKGCHGG